MKRIFLSTVSALALAHGATAADMPYKAPPPPVVVQNWTGWYLGIQGGIARHSASLTDLDGLSNFAGPAVLYSSSKTGGVFGVNSGYNFQAGVFVFGVEGDWNWLGVNAATTFITTNLPTTTSLDVRWLATARARVGLAVDATLFYVTGGVAFGQVNNTASVFVGPGTTNLRGAFSENTTKTGWTGGGGIEHMFGPHWTARVEARWVDLGRSTVTCTAPCNVGGTYRGEFSNKLFMGLVALDFKF